MDIEEYLDQVIADLKAMLPGKVKVDKHPGRFELAELERYSVNAPCLRVAMLTQTNADMSTPFLICEMAAYLVTKPGRAGAADRQQRQLGAALIQAISLKTDFGGAGACRAEKLRFTNLYNIKVGEDQVGLGALTFSQCVEQLVDLGSLGSFQTLFASFDEGADGKPEMQDQTTFEGA